MPAIMEPVRPTDAAGVEVSPPSPEVIPFPDRPLTIDDFDALALDFEGGGAYVTADGKEICGLPSTAKPAAKSGSMARGFTRSSKPAATAATSWGSNWKALRRSGRSVTRRPRPETGQELTIGRPLRISFGSMKRTDSSTVRSSETSSTPRSRKS